MEAKGPGLCLRLLTTHWMQTTLGEGVWLPLVMALWVMLLSLVKAVPGEGFSCEPSASNVPGNWETLACPEGDLGSPTPTTPACH